MTEARRAEAGGNRRAYLDVKRVWRVETLVPKDYGRNSLRAAGLLGLSPRTYRRACRPPNGLERIFDDLGPLDGGHIVAD